MVSPSPMLLIHPTSLHSSFHGQELAIGDHKKSPNTEERFFFFGEHERLILSAQDQRSVENQMELQRETQKG
jgi:hypothetical protein